MLKPRKPVRFWIFLIQNLCAAGIYITKDVSSCPFQDALSGLMYVLQLELLFDGLIPRWRIKEVVEECSQFQRELVTCQWVIKAYPHISFWEDCEVILSRSKTWVQQEGWEKSIRMLNFESVTGCADRTMGGTYKHSHWAVSLPSVTWCLSDYSRSHCILLGMSCSFW